MRGVANHYHLFDNQQFQQFVNEYQSREGETTDGVYLKRIYEVHRRSVLAAIENPTSPRRGLNIEDIVPSQTSLPPLTPGEGN